ncbi:hypothetical protein KFK09_011580 [Dendrobium nobile]|uniref:Uncharacterized protein n=1 Tax=Dendrobium nobile TaxID=94219 RepID=A0A8T3BEZ4_DENNO|nr:hypothetical protein KFK09_011580 [Dendrobium nobile]
MGGAAADLGFLNLVALSWLTSKACEFCGREFTFDEFEICPVRMISKYIALHDLASLKSPCNLSASCRNLASGPLSDLSCPHDHRTALATSHCFMMSSPLTGPPPDLIVSHDDLATSPCLSLHQSRLPENKEPCEDEEYHYDEGDERLRYRRGIHRRRWWRMTSNDRPSVTTKLAVENTCEDRDDSLQILQILRRSKESVGYRCSRRRGKLIPTQAPNPPFNIEEGRGDDKGTSVR